MLSYILHASRVNYILSKVQFKLTKCQILPFTIQNILIKKHNIAYRAPLLFTALSQYTNFPMKSMYLIYVCQRSSLIAPALRATLLQHKRGLTITMILRALDVIDTSNRVSHVSNTHTHTHGDRLVPVLWTFD